MANFPTDWDVNRYKADYESDEHWELRKAFMEMHKDKFAEDDLVCLAQVFTNIEFLGCRYPNKTMERVALLSKEVAAKFRASRDGRLKRTFVGASDAASAKAKGRGSQSQTTKPINQILGTIGSKKFPSLHSSFKKQESTTQQDESSDDNNVKNCLQSDDDEDDGTFVRPSFSMDSTSTKQQNEEKIIPAASTFTVKTKHTERIQDTGFIIYETIAQTGQTSSNILQVSAAKQGATVKFDAEACNDLPNKLQGVVRINGIVYAAVPITTGKKEAKVHAFDKALEYARKIHYTIKQKSVHTVSVDVEQNDSGETQNTQNTQNIQLDADNKGFKMMKMLGWSGGALGVSGNGIEQPISIEMKVDRSGLGLSSDSTKLNYDFFVNYLTKYKSDESATYDLAFSKDFTKDERKTLHEIANRLALKSRSHNTADGSRYIVIFKRLELIDLANEILNDGLRAKCYELIQPTEPLPEKSRPIQKKPAPYIEQRNANRIGFNYKQRNMNYNTKPNKLQNKRKKFV